MTRITKSEADEVAHEFGLSHALDTEWQKANDYAQIIANRTDGGPNNPKDLLRHWYAENERIAKAQSRQAGDGGFGD